MSDWVFLSHPLSSDTPSYGGRDTFLAESTSCMDEGSHCNTARWSFPNHLGTHLDAPLHFDRGGKSVTDFPASSWVFSKPLLVDCPSESNRLLEPRDLEGPLKGSGPDLLLLRTGFEKHRGSEPYWEENPGLSPELGAWLRARFPSVRAVGLDAISISRWSDRETGRKAHRAFLEKSRPGSPLILIEDMHLARVPAGAVLSEAIVLPLRVEAADGAPCSVIARLA